MALHGITAWHRATLLGGLLFATTAHSQSVTPEEAAGDGSGQGNGTEQRLSQIERFLEKRSLLELAQSISALRDEIRLLHGQLEEQQHQMGRLQQRQQEIYIDLDRRVQILSKSGLVAPNNAGSMAGALPDPAGDIANLVQPVVPATGGSDASAVVPIKTVATTTDASPGDAPGIIADNQDPAEPPEPNTIAIPVIDPLRIAAEYDRAFSEMRSGNYRNALTSFTNWLENYQDALQRANALFWKAEILYIQENYTDAIATYQELLQNHPANRKREQALLKMGYSQDALGDLTTAINTLDKVVQNFPGSAVSQLARQRLTEIRARNNTAR